VLTNRWLTRGIFSSAYLSPNLERMGPINQPFDSLTAKVGIGQRHQFEVPKMRNAWGCASGAATSREDVALAHELLAAYANLRTVAAKGAQLRREFRDQQIGSEEWAWWYDHHYEPAYSRFDDALVALKELLGENFPGRYPWDFVKACWDILGAPSSEHDP
jgi:hypothetical protein